MRRILAFAATTAAVAWAPAASAAGAPPAVADFRDEGIGWRPFSGEAFREAARTRRPVFLVLTAPWTWDHFLLPDRVFSDEGVRSAIAEGWVPVVADAEEWPELRALWSIPSGLLPSFHFLDAEGRAFASAAPLGTEELAFRLDQWADPSRRPAFETEARAPTMRIPGDFADAAATLLIDRSQAGELGVADAHRDLDPGALLFLAAEEDGPLPAAAGRTLAREILRLRAGPLWDPVDGGFHRTWAIPDTLPHFEKTLHVNLRMGRLLCMQFVRTRNLTVGRDALGILRFLNGKLRAGTDPVYAASLAADVFDHAGRELIETGADHYAVRDAEVRARSAPPASGSLPAGGNLEAMAVFGIYASVFGDARVVDAVRRAAPRLLAEALEPDGRVRRVLGRPGPGNLLDQAEGGLGLLAIHGLTGSHAAWNAVLEVARGLEAHYGAGRGIYRSVADDADVPRALREAPEDPAWNGEALRFLAELAAVTRDERWLRAVRSGIDAWSARMPADARGAGELGEAALGLGQPPAVFLCTGDPDTDEGRRLLALALGLNSPRIRVRWVRGEDAREVQRRFGVRLETEPALYLVHGAGSAALRDADVVRAVWAGATER